MFNTNGDFVATIRNDLNALNKDDYVSARYILSIAYPYVRYLVNTRPLQKLFRDVDAFTYVPCIELKQIKTFDCCIAEFKTCDKIMRSKKPIPEILNTKAGLAIEAVLNANNSDEYDPLRTAADFLNTKKRQFGGKFKYFYIGNEGGGDYLYLLNTTNELVNMNAAFLSENEALALSTCSEEDFSCASRLEDKFVCPEEFHSTVRDQTLASIVGGRKQIVADERPDLDSNQKGALL